MALSNAVIATLSFAFIGGSAYVGSLKLARRTKKRERESAHAAENESLGRMLCETIEERSRALGHRLWLAMGTKDGATVITSTCAFGFIRVFQLTLPAEPGGELAWTSDFETGDIGLPRRREELRDEAALRNILLLVDRAVRKTRAS